MSTAVSPVPPRSALSEPFLAVEDLKVHFPTDDGLVKSVDGLTFSLQPGEILGIVGESGSGKSVTAQAILGLHKGSQARVTGSIRMNGRDLVTASEDDMRAVRGSEIAMIFQDPLSALHPFYTIGQQITEAYRVHNKVSAKEGRAKTVEMLQKVGIPNASGRYDDYPHQFSGGMRQRAMIAMALICKPRLLIADEPTTALDVTVQAQILELIKELRNELDSAVILITHDLGVVAETCDQVVVMYGGQCVEKGPVDELFAQPEMPYTWGLLGSMPRMDRVRETRLTPIPGSPPSLINVPKGCVFNPRCRFSDRVAGGKCFEVHPDLQASSARHEVRCHIPHEERVEILDGRDPTHALSPEGIRDMTSTAPAPAAADSTSTAPLLEVTDVTKHFPGKTIGLLGRRGNPVKAVDGVSFVVHEGETLGLVGESGCGKSTTGRAVSKLIEPTSGSIRFGGRDISGLSQRQMRPLRRQMQMIFQDPYSSLNPRHTIGTIVGSPYHIQGEHPKGGIKRTVQGLMERVGLNPEHYNRYPHEFSGGQRQRIGIARALALQPKLIVCDEPVSALDVSVQAQVVNLLEDLQNEFGLAYIFIAHDLSVVRHISDRVAVMYLGKIMEITDRDSLYEHPMHPYTHALLSAVPIPDPKIEARREKILLTGDLPSPSNPPKGCVFHTRCPKFRLELSDTQREHCRTVEPVLEDKRPGQSVYCHFPEARTDLIEGEPAPESSPIRTTKPKVA